MEPKVSLPSSQELTACPCSPEPDESSQGFLSQFLRYFLILSWHLWLCLPNGLFPSGFPTKSLYAPLPICVTYRNQSHSSWFDQPNNVRCGVKITKLIIIQSSPVPYYLISLTPNYIPQCPILEHPQPVYFPKCEVNYQSKYETVGRVTVQCIFVFFFFFLSLPITNALDKILDWMIASIPHI